MDAGDPATTGHIKHVAHAQKLFSTLFTQDRAAVDLGRHLEADPGGEVRLDRTGDHIDRGTLGRHDQVDTGRARHLREALDAGLDLFASNHHQVGHLIDDDDDVDVDIDDDILDDDDDDDDTVPLDDLADVAVNDDDT